MAIKKINLKGKHQEEREIAISEIETLISCDHPHVIKIYEAYEEP